MNLLNLAPGQSSADAAAAAAQAWYAIETDTAAEAAWPMADNNNAFDRLINNLFGVSVSAKTMSAAFNNATDSLALVSNADWRLLAGASEVNIEAAEASSEMFRWLKPKSITLATEVSTGERLALDTKAGITEPSSMQWHPDGFRFYVFDQAGRKFEEFSTAVRWSTAPGNVTAVAEVLMTAQESAPKGAAISPDGTHVALVGNQERIYLYTLSTPWDITTMSYASAYYQMSTYTDPTDVAWNNDGTKIYVLFDAAAGYVLVEYSMGTAYDVANASQTNVLDVSSFAPRPQGFSISRGGTRLLITCYQNDAIYQRTLTTAWSLAAVTGTSSLDISGLDTRPFGLAQSPNGVHVYLVGDTNNTIYHLKSIDGFAPY